MRKQRKGTVEEWTRLVGGGGEVVFVVCVLGRQCFERGEGSRKGERASNVAKTVRNVHHLDLTKSQNS